MTVTQDGVRFEHNIRRSVVLFFVVCVEVILSFFVYVALTANLIWPEKSRAATGVASVLAYEGRLMDASGNPLGGTGEPYCFRFSIYDAASGGTKLWPSGTPATSTATTTDGVFNALVGQADVLDYNFYGSDTTFLNVDVYTATSTNGINCFGGTWETLAPRQRIAATGYARSAENVYSSLFSTDVSNGIVHIGTGAGVPGTPKFLGLDVKSASEYVGQSCSTSGTLWYNSAISKALVCENGTIQTIGNSSATTTIAAFTANNGTPAVTGTIVFTNSNGVSFGINGNTITASVNGLNQVMSYWPVRPWALTNITNNTGTTGNTGGSTQFTANFFMAPMLIENAVTFNRIDMLVSNVTVAGTGSGSVNRNLGIYSLNGGTAFTLVSSFLFRHDMSQNSVTAQSHRFYWGTNSTSNSSSSGGNISANYAGIRAVPVHTGANSLSAGQYFLVYGQNNLTAGSNVVSGYQNMYVSEANTTAGQLGSAASIGPVRFMGVFSSTTNTNVITAQFMPNSINTSALTHTGGTSQWRYPAVNIYST